MYVLDSVGVCMIGGRNVSVSLRGELRVAGVWLC
jgi:hypothetical protein